MQAQNRGVKWIAVVAIAAVAGACEGMTPTATEAPLSPEAAPSFATASASEVGRVYLLPFSWTIALGETKLYAALAKSTTGAMLPLAGRNVVWSSSDKSVATVDGNGLATSRGGGTTVISVSVDGVTATSTLTINAPVSVASATLAPSAMEIEVGERGFLTAVPLTSAGTPVVGEIASFTSSKPGVVAVYGNGMVIGLRPGTATITATVAGKTATSTVTVAASQADDGVRTIRVLPENALLGTGQVRSLSIFMYNAKGRGVNLSNRTVEVVSSNPAVARVIDSGRQSWVVQGGTPGTAEITVTINGVKGSSTFFVGKAN